MANAQQSASPIIPTRPDKIFTPCKQKTKSGLGYTMLKHGRGALFSEGVFTITYIGYVSSTQKQYAALNKSMKPTFNYELSGQIEGLKMMRVGDTIKLCIPSDLAYGDVELKNIPANSELIEFFTIHNLTNSEKIESSLKEFRKKM